MKDKDKKKIIIIYSIMYVVMFLIVLFMFLSKKEQAVNISSHDLAGIKLSTQAQAVNVASPDLVGKEYLGNGDYFLSTERNVNTYYNVFNGIFHLTSQNNQEVNSSNKLILLEDLGAGQYTVTIEYLSFGNGLTPTGTVYLRDNLGEVARITRSSSNKHTTTINLSRNTQGLYFYTYMPTANVIDFKLRIQIEKGSTATNYQVPIQPRDYHIQLERNEAYEQGFNDGFDEVFNSNNLIPVAEKKGKGGLGQSPEYFGFRVPINTKVKSIMLLNSVGWSLKPLEWTAGNSLYQGLQIKYQSGLTDFIRFKDTYDNYQDVMEFELDRDLQVEYIDIIFALNDPTIIQARFNDLQNSMIKNLGFYINNKVLNDEAIARFKQIIEFELRDTLKDEYKDIYYQQGYQKGLTENTSGGFSNILFSIFGGFGTFFAIELLPNVSIGAIILIPIVFGLIAFIIGRKRD